MLKLTPEGLRGQRGQLLPVRVPESFRVLVKELQSLGLDMRVLDEDNNEVELRDLDEGEDDDIIHVDDLEKARAKAAADAAAAFAAEEAEGKE